MRIKILGNWYDIECIEAYYKQFNAEILENTECDIEDVEINGRHLAHLNNEVSKSEAVEPQDNKPTEKVGKEDIFPTKNGKFRVGDEVMTIGVDGKIFHGRISKINDYLCQVIGRDGNTLTGVLLSELVDDSDDADFNYKQAQIRKKQAEYWEKRAENLNSASDGFYYHTKEEPKQYTIAPPEVHQPIDWEQRTYDLAAQIYVKRQYSTQGCYNDAKAFVDEYRKEAKL
jgi:hypothetical protein